MALDLLGPIRDRAFEGRELEDWFKSIDTAPAAGCLSDEELAAARFFLRQQGSNGLTRGALARHAVALLPDLVALLEDDRMALCWPTALEILRQSGPQAAVAVPAVDRLVKHPDLRSLLIPLLRRYASLEGRDRDLRGHPRVSMLAQEIAHEARDTLAAIQR